MFPGEESSDMEGFQKVIFDVPRIGIYVRFVDFFKGSY